MFRPRVISCWWVGFKKKLSVSCGGAHRKKIEVQADLGMVLANIPHGTKQG